MITPKKIKATKIGLSVYVLAKLSKYLKPSTKKNINVKMVVTNDVIFENLALVFL